MIFLNNLEFNDFTILLNYFIKTKFYEYIILIEIFVCGYFDRRVFSVLFLILAFHNNMKGKDGKYTLILMISSIFTIILPSYEKIIIIIGSFYFMITHYENYFRNKFKIFQSLFLLFIFSTVIILISDYYQYNENVSFEILKILNWSIFLLSISLPFLLKKYYDFNFEEKIDFLFISFLTPLLLLSVSFEISFFVTLKFLLLFWSRSLKYLNEIEITLYFVFYF
jgi:hypothetical protein